MVIEKKGWYWNPILDGVSWVTEEGGKSQLPTVRSKLVHGCSGSWGVARDNGVLSAAETTSAHAPLPHAALGSEVPLQS